MAEADLPVWEDSIAEHYGASEADWRRIDNDWMAAAGPLALPMDGLTNNTSLMLALELVASGKVLLFAGDAETSNREGWRLRKPPHGSPTVDDLLGRTVLYKVGRHGSINATRIVGGLDKREPPDLVAMIPVDPRVFDTEKSPVPHPDLPGKLARATRYRVLQTPPEPYAVFASEAPASSPERAKREQWCSTVEYTDEWVEYTVAD